MRNNLSVRILVGLVVGAIAGSTGNAIAPDSPLLDGFVRYVTEPAGSLFLRLLFMLVVPLILSALALGVSGLGDLRHLGRVGGRTFAYTATVSIIAVLLGVTLVNVFRPGDGLSLETKEAIRATLTAPPGLANAGPTGVDFLVNLVPANIVRAMADGDMLAVMVFSLFLGIGLLSVPATDAVRSFESALNGLFEVVMRMLGHVISLAPIGVACLLFTVTARTGFDVLRQLGAYVFVVLLALAIQQFVVYSFFVRVLGNMSPLAFFRAVRPAMLTAFSTASSNATLPTALLVAERDLKLPQHVSRFVLTLGATANQNGTALFEGITVLFLAQFYDVDLTFAQQLLVVSICVLGGIGTAGVPAGSLPVIAMLLKLVGVPVEGIGMIVGVDRFLDMCRTTINVTGDLSAAVVVSRYEK
jgi:DAACS family dicarboxylate/amino acid:cation (Na+ or H+) symporter